MNETHQDPLVADPQSDRSERLVDYLYDELSPEARAAFEDELASDPALAAELDALRGARAPFASLPLEPMPRGLLDDVLKQADAQALTFAKAEARKSAGAPSFFQRALEGLRHLVFQPAFAMGMVLIMVAGVALVATRNPSEIAGMEVARDVPRLPPVAMAPAADTPAPVAQVAPAREAAAAVPIQEPEAELALEDLAKVNAEPAPAPDLQGGLAAAGRGAANEEKPARFIEARVKGDFDAGKPRPTEPPKAARPTTASDKSKDGLSALDSFAEVDSGAAWAGPGAAEDARGSAGGVAEGSASKGDSGTAATAPRAAPDVTEVSNSGSRNAPKAEAPAPAAERARADTAREVEERAEKKVSRDAPVETAKAPARREGIDDEAIKVPSAPPLPTNKPTEPAPSGERLYNTLKQQLAAGALADAEKSLTELARLEGESTRVKQAREVLAQAKAAAESGATRPADTKPLPEPTRTPR